MTILLKTKIIAEAYASQGHVNFEFFHILLSAGRLPTTLQRTAAPTSNEFQVSEKQPVEIHFSNSLLMMDYDRL